MKFDLKLFMLVFDLSKLMGDYDNMVIYESWNVERKYLFKFTLIQWSKFFS